MMEASSRIHERLVLGAVILGGIAALVFGFSYLGKSIAGPLRLQPKTLKTPIEQELEAKQELRTKDTDKDDLSDYDEQYVWNTSAYLADSDSDGIDDKTEIDRGDNPNCPTGQTCGAGAATAADQQGTTSANPETLQPPRGTVPVGATGDFVQLLQTLPPDEIRRLLIEYGVPREQLDKLDDAALLKLYEYSIQQTVKQMEETQKPSTIGESTE